MRILALVPARGGSKRVPGKNVRPLHGKPLIVWSIASAMGAPEVCDVLVSTDDPAIAEVARGAGALVPWLRPSELATDTATSTDVALHALDWYENTKAGVDGLLLLQPTSPFRTTESIARAVELFRMKGRTVVSVSPAADHPMWCYRVEDGALRPFVDDPLSSARSQDLPPAFKLNGSIYLIPPTVLREAGTFVPRDAVPLIMDSAVEALDIDTETDWQHAIQQDPPTS